MNTFSFAKKTVRQFYDRFTRRLFNRVGFLVVPFTLGGSGASAIEIINLQPLVGDMTPIVRSLIDSVDSEDVRLVFAPGEYHFKPGQATQRYSYITNHDNGLKNIAFPLVGFESVEIVGNGAELIFHGRMLPFFFEDCESVKVAELSIDWDVPFNFLAEVVAVNEADAWCDVKPVMEGFSWKLVGEQINFPEIDGYSFSSMGSVLAFTADTKRVIHGGLDITSHPRRVEKRVDGILRIHEDLRQFPPVGSMYSAKGPRGENRYAPAFHVVSSRNTNFEDVVVHHALGMGFLFERTENITLRGGGVYLKEGTNRVISSTADATHFANCKGSILIEDARFENMLADGTNVRGTYVVVDQIIDDHTVRTRLGHFQQLGFEFAGAGDEVWFVHQPNPSRGRVNAVASVETINDRFSVLKFVEKLPAALQVGDILENKTWNPDFTMRGCVVRDNRARNIVLKTPGKIVIEDNDFSSHMSSIFFRGETFHWYESGAVEDVLIRNNRFDYCAYSGMEHAVLRITPGLGQAFDATIPFDRNIRFVDNEIKTFDPRIVWADRVEGLVIKNNVITQSHHDELLHPKAAMFEFTQCRDVEITGNTFEGSFARKIQVDEATRPTLTVEGNSGI